MYHRLLAALLVVACMVQITPRTNAQNLTTAFSAFAVDITLGEPASGWRRIEVTLGFANRGAFGNLIQIVDYHPVLIEIAEGRAYEAQLNRGYFGILPPGMVSCSFLSEETASRSAWQSVIVTGRVPEMGTPSSLVIKEGEGAEEIARVDLTAVHGIDACRANVSQLPSLQDEIIVGGDGIEINLSVRFDLAANGQEISLAVKNLDVFSDVPIDPVVFAGYEHGGWTRAFTVDESDTCPHFTGEYVVVGPGHEQSLAYCLPATEHQVTAIVAGFGTRTSGDWYAAAKTDRTGGSEDAPDWGAEGVPVSLTEVNGSGVRGTIRIFGDESSFAIEIEELVNFDTEELLIAVQEGDCSEAYVGEEHYFNAWTGPVMLFDLDDTGMTGQDLISGLGGSTGSVSFALVLAIPNMVIVAEVTNGIPTLVACGEVVVPGAS